MSWSIMYIGKPEKVADALEAHAAKLEGQSKAEYDAALPSMRDLVKQNFGNDTQLIKITANGHGSVVNGEQKYRTIACNIESVYGAIV